MKKIFLFSIALVLFSTIFSFAQDINTSIAPPASGRGTVGQPMVFEATIEALGGSYTNFQWTLSFPSGYVATPNSPTGGLAWTQINPGTWQATVAVLTGALSTTISVTPTAPSATAIQIANSSVSGFWENNMITNNDSQNATFYIDPAAANTITVTPATSSVNTNTPVTLTASGCTGGTYSWSPAGGTASGATYTVTSATAANTTYTATCSTGGSGTASVTWTTSTPTCLANAGTLN